MRSYHEVLLDYRMALRDLEHLNKQLRLARQIPGQQQVEAGLEGMLTDRKRDVMALITELDMVMREERNAPLLPMMSNNKAGEGDGNVGSHLR